MNKLKVILASASPRRRELLEQVGIKCRVVPSNADENITEEVPELFVKALAAKKAGEVAARTEAGSIVIGADTIVVLGHLIMGKPENQAHAAEMLRQLQGNTHQVYTGVTVIIKEPGQELSFTFFEATEVSMYPMSAAEIAGYIATSEPMDKAGAYGIQGNSAIYIKGIKGDYNNVVGLPVARLYQELKRREIVLW